MGEKTEAVRVLCSPSVRKGIRDRNVLLAAEIFDYFVRFAKYSGGKPGGNTQGVRTPLGFDAVR